MASLETKLQKQIDKLVNEEDKAKITFPRYLKVINTQVLLFSAVHILTKNSDFGLPEKVTGTGIIGKIDCVFRYRATNYICEIKDNNKKNMSFWYATKALAYCEYYKWQVDDTSFKPAVLVPLSSLRLEHQLVAGKLGIAVFVFSMDSDGWFTIKPVSDIPYWKQML